MDWKAISDFANNLVAKAKPVIDALEPVVEAGVKAYAPEAAVGLALGEKLLHGFMTGVPAATAIVSKIANGTPATEQELKDFDATYEADYQASRNKLADAMARARAAQH